MKVTSCTELALPGVQILRFARFRDARGYFTEHLSHREVARALAFAVGESFDVQQVRSALLPTPLKRFCLS